MFSRLLSIAVLGGFFVACASTAKDSETRAPLDEELVQLRQANAKLRKRVQLLEDRLLQLEKRGQGRGEAPDRGLPVVEVEPEAQPETNPSVRGEEGEPAPGRVRGAVSLDPLPHSGTDPDPASDAQVSEDAPESAWEGREQQSLLATGEQQTRVRETRTDDGRRSFRLEGSRLVELTKAKAPKHPDRPQRGRKGDAIIAEYQAAREVYKAGRYVRAEAMFDAFAREHAQHDYADNALYWKGEAAYDQQHYADALASFIAVVEQYGGGNKAPDALLKVGLCYRKIGDLDNARDVLTELIGAYPRARASDIARAKLVEIEGAAR